MLSILAKQTFLSHWTMHGRQVFLGHLLSLFVFVCLCVCLFWLIYCSWKAVAIYDDIPMTVSAYVFITHHQHLFCNVWLSWTSSLVCHDSFKIYYAVVYKLNLCEGSKYPASNDHAHLNTHNSIFVTNVRRKLLCDSPINALSRKV